MIKQPKNFMIFAHPRCGSSQLTNILNLNEIITLYEPFAARRYERKYQNIMEKYDLKTTINHIFQKYQGFKQDCLHLQYQQNIQLITSYPTIFIYRNNITNTVLSHQTATRTNIWHKEQTNEKNYIKQIEIIPKKFLEDVQKFSHMISIYKSQVKDHIEVQYEELYGENGYQHLERIFEFIKKRIKNPEKSKKMLSPEHKLNSTPWQQFVVNWNDIEKIIQENNLQMPN